MQGATEASEPVTLLVNYLTRPSDEEVAWYEQTLGATVKFRYDTIPTLAVIVDEDQIDAVAERPGIEFIEQDQTYYVTDINNTWGVEYIGGGYTLQDGLFGTGIKMGVIDTGVDYTHPELAAIYKGGVDIVNQDADPMDDNFHGTHVSGTIAAAQDGVGVVGVAPGVDLYAIKGFDAAGSGQTSNLVACVDWSTTNGMDIVNNSWGGGGSSTLRNVFAASRAAGVIHVCAAGNNYGFFGVSVPAKYDSTYAISAIDDRGQIAQFSDRGEEIDFAAPGVDVYSSNLGGGYVFASGTSMASPHAAGVVALVMAHGDVTDTDGDGTLFTEIRDRMAKAAMDIGEPGEDNLYGHGIINAKASIVEPMDLQVTALNAGLLAGAQCTGCTPGDQVMFLYSMYGGRVDVPQANTVMGLKNPKQARAVTADAAGVATLQFFVPPSLAGMSGFMQAVEASSNTSTRAIVSVN